MLQHESDVRLVTENDQPTHLYTHIRTNTEQNLHQEEKQNNQQSLFLAMKAGKCLQSHYRLREAEPNANANILTCSHSNVLMFKLDLWST